MKKLSSLLVVSSTYPANETDTVPRFVKDQLEEFIKIRPHLKIVVLAPHNENSNRINEEASINSPITEKRFHYSLKSFEHLTDRGILPALSTNKFYYFLLPFLQLAEIVAVWRATRKYKPELLYAHWFTPQAISCGVVSFLTKTPFVFTTHAHDVGVWKRFGPLGRKVVSFFANEAAAITSVSRRTNEKLEFFIPEKNLENIRGKTSIIPMGVSPKSNKLETFDKSRILFIGRLTEKKGLEYLLLAMKNLVGLNPKTKLIIAGDGELRQKLENQTRNLKIEKNVIFKGFVNGKEKESLFLSCGVMIVPSIITDRGDAEGLPVSLLEGLCSGMICIATKESGADDIIVDKLNGYLIPQKDPEALSRAILALDNLTKKQLVSIRHNALKSSRKISWPNIAKQHLEIFDKVITDKKL